MRSSILPSFARGLTVALASAARLAACSKSSAEKPPQAAPAAAVGAPGPAVASGPAPAASLPGTRYGGGVTVDDAASTVTVDELLANPQAYAGKTMRVEGMVTDVCPKRGCWMDLAGDGPGQKVRLKVEDGVMTFPMEAKGSQAVVQGTIAVETMTLDESRAYAKHQAEEYGAAYDPESITEPMVIVRIDGTGAVVRDSK